MKVDRVDSKNNTLPQLSSQVRNPNAKVVLSIENIVISNKILIRT